MWPSAAGKYVTGWRAETPRSIAAQLGLDLRELLRYNNTRLYNGQMKCASAAALTSQSRRRRRQLTHWETGCVIEVSFVGV